MALTFMPGIGRLGGKRGRSGGFAAGPEGRKRASYYGAKGGSLSRRPQKAAHK